MDTLQELYARRELALVCIRTVSAVTDGDPRKESALKEYNRQLAEIDAKITEAGGKPPDTVIGLKSATLTAEVNKKE